MHPKGQTVPVEKLLPQVSKPTQYLGNEVNVIRKDWDAARVRVALVFPDKYEMGMSHVGLKILYEILNGLPHVVAERVYAPELDMQALLKSEGLPLFSLESKHALSDFDIVGFSLTYELTYTNMLSILDLAQIPLWQKDRTERHPLVIAGGGCLMNAEPVADFLDAACLGDGEDIVLDIVRAVDEWKKSEASRHQILDTLSAIEGIYVPSFFEPEYHDDGTLACVKPLKAGYERINKRTLKSLDDAPYPTKLVVPTVKPIHDRIGIEIQRGCNRACRFCQAGYIDRPVRQRSPEKILKIAEESLQQTGIEQISLLSLSAADFACLVPLLKELNSRYVQKNIAISVPATRTENLTPELVEQIKQVRKTGFTVAPEAGSERMRRVINKGNKVGDLFRAVTNAFSQGWELLKLYYMVGLPFEQDEDVVGIAQEGNDCIKLCKTYTPRAELNLSVSSFVPKPHTPFQWSPQMTIEETKRRHALVRQNLKDKRIRFKHHHPEMSYVEGLLSRGDRRVARVIARAFELGCRFDEWDEHFNFGLWQQALADTDTDPAFYLHRERTKDEVLPWDHLYAQMDKAFLWEELEKAHDAAFTPDCSVSVCSDCGVCDFRHIKNRIFVVGEKPVMVKKGNREWYGWQPESPQTSSSFAKVSGPAPFRLRIRFSKTGLARFMGHLELMDALKRAIKRLGWPVSYSEGFHPQMRLAMGHPLPVGLESQWEYFDLDLTRTISNEEALALGEALPDGLDILSAEFVDKKSPSIYSSVAQNFYSVLPAIPQDPNWFKMTTEALARFSTSNTLPFSRGKAGKEKTFNIKDEVQIIPETLPESFSFKTRINTEGTLKPQEVVLALLGVGDKDLHHFRFKKIGVGWKGL